MLTATRERPILFSGPMVRAILAGRKTQTRRTVKGEWTFEGDESGCGWEPPRCPYGVAMDRLWVRETHVIAGTGCVFYKANPENDVPFDKRDWAWTPSIHKRREHSRITLEITGVRVERLQEISEEDAAAEGFECFVGPHQLRGCYWEGPGYWDGFSLHSDHGGKTYHAAYGGDPRCRCNVGMAENLTPARCAFRHIWDHINGKRPGCDWEANPWVWVIEFRRVEKEVYPA
jgi:hypothetical protein